METGSYDFGDHSHKKIEFDYVCKIGTTVPTGHAELNSRE